MCNFLWDITKFFQILEPIKQEYQVVNNLNDIISPAGHPAIDYKWTCEPLVTIEFFILAFLNLLMLGSFTKINEMHQISILTNAK